jgi:plasmid stabilization system protein ParE
MVKRVEWRKKALRRLGDILLYLKEERSHQAAVNLAETTQKKIKQLENQSLIGRKSTKGKTIRLINIDKHRQMFYSVNGSTLFIVDFFDTRQDPSKRPY